MSATRSVVAFTRRAPQPFCTDDTLEIDPDCQQFDTGADPLISTWKARSSIVIACSSIAPVGFSKLPHLRK